MHGRMLCVVVPLDNDLHMKQVKWWKSFFRCDLTEVNKILLTHKKRSVTVTQKLMTKKTSETRNCNFPEFLSNTALQSQEGRTPLFIYQEKMAT